MLNQGEGREGEGLGNNLREAATEDEDMLPIPAHHPFHLDSCQDQNATINGESDTHIIQGVCVCHQ